MATTTRTKKTAAKKTSNKSVDRVKATSKKIKATTVDEYINAAPKEAQKNLREIRAILKDVAPKAMEAIKWRSPVYEENRINVFVLRVQKSHDVYADAQDVGSL